MINLWKDPNELSEKEAAASVRYTTLWVILITLLVVKAVSLFVGAEIDVESPLYLIQQSLRVGLAGMVTGLFRTLVVLGLGFGAVQFTENTRFGQRLREHKAVLYGAILVAIALAFGVR